MIETIEVSRRKCGLRKMFSFYIVGGTKRSGEGPTLAFSLISPPIPYPIERIHRTGRIVDTNAVLDRKPLDEWFDGRSKDTQLDKVGASYEAKTYGMPWAQRRKIGDASFHMTPESFLAWAARQNTALTNKRFYDNIRAITTDESLSAGKAASAVNDLLEIVHYKNKQQDVIAALLRL